MHTVTVDVAKPHDLQWIADLERQHYGPMRAVAQARLEEWYAANPGGFLVLREGRERLGHITLLPLRPHALGALVNGSMSENEIEGNDIFGPDERGDVREIYIESVIAQPLELFGELVRTFEKHVARIADPGLVEALYVCPLTAAGELIAANLQFRPIAGNRSMYRVECPALIQRTAALRKTMEAAARAASVRFT